MTQMQWIMELALWGGGLLFWTCTLFPAVIAIAWPWWQSWWGRNIVSLEIALATALVPSILRTEFGIIPNTYIFGWLIVGSLFAAASIVIWRGIMIFRVQRDESKADRY